MQVFSKRDIESVYYTHEIMNYFTRAWDNIDDKVVHVRDLSKDSRNGNKCNCSGVECKEPLEACQGEKRSWYFRHQNPSTCSGGPMTALHLLAQQILEGDHTIKTIDGNISYSKGIKEYKRKGSSFIFDIGAKIGDEKEFIIEVWVKQICLIFILRFGQNYPPIYLNHSN
jgi:hypothetical protein